MPVFVTAGNSAEGIPENYDDGSEDDESLESEDSWEASKGSTSPKSFTGGPSSPKQPRPSFDFRARIRSVVQSTPKVQRSEELISSRSSS